ncbi:MAG: galactose-1-phosphate uridylyltransferase, partial [Anaerolineae bacterium]
MNLAEQPHRRYNPLAGEWVLVSPQRTRRPWLGQTESPPPDTRLPYDPACYLCPGNKRAGGAQNPPYRGTFVFDNDFAALLPGSPSKTPPPPPTGTASLLRAEPERGICRVMCYSPQHNLTLPEMPLAVIERVVEVWVEQYRELGARPHLNWVQI